MAIELLKRIPALRTTLATDVQAAYEGDPACHTTDEIVFCYPGFEAITVYRIAFEHLRLGKGAAAALILLLFLLSMSMLFIRVLFREQRKKADAS